MRILLLGANGQVGTELVRSLAFAEELITTTRVGDRNADTIGLDVSDLAAVRACVLNVQPDLVVNATAYTAVDRAESEPDRAARINADAPATLAEACASIGARLVHYSTDYVFDGRARAPYKEGDATSPLGVYGETKLAGERAIHSRLDDALILRTAWVYALHGANFLRTMLRLASERDELRVVADQVGSPTPAWFIAEATATLISANVAPGVFNVVCEGQTSWHGFAEAIFEESSTRGAVLNAPRVTAISTSDYPTRARRPAYSVLDTTRLRGAGVSVPGWRQALTMTFDRRSEMHPG